jgi:ABC-type amino acid transport substrate-binding protein
MRQFYISLAFFVCTLIAYPSSAELLKVGLPGLEGFVVLGERKIPKGPIPNMLESAEKALGINVEISIQPLARLLKLLEVGGLDIGMFIQSNKRDRLYTPLLHIGDSHAIAVVLQPHKLHNSNDFKDLRIAYLRGATLLSFLTVFATKVETNSHVDSARLLKYGRVDAMVSPDFRLWPALREMGLSLDKI